MKKLHGILKNTNDDQQLIPDLVQRTQDRNSHTVHRIEANYQYTNHSRCCGRKIFHCNGSQPGNSLCTMGTRWGTQLQHRYFYVCVFNERDGKPITSVKNLTFLEKTLECENSTENVTY